MIMHDIQMTQALNKQLKNGREYLEYLKLLDKYIYITVIPSECFKLEKGK